MQNSINDLVEITIREIISEMMSGGPSHGGAASFRGGPYGYGNTAQLAVNLDPATKKIQNQEQEEINANIEDQDFINNKFGTNMSFGLADNDGELEGQKQDIQLQERNAADSLYTHLPGYPRPGAIEYPVQHVPEENKMPNNLRAGVHDGTDEYMLDDIIDELEEKEKMLDEASSLANPQGGLYQKKSALPPFMVNPPEEDEGNLSLGHMYMKSADHSSIGSYSSVLFPKKFVPEEQTQQSDIEDEDMDGLSDQIDLDQPDYITKLRTNHD